MSGRRAASSPPPRKAFAESWPSLVVQAFACHRPRPLGRQDCLPYKKPSASIGDSIERISGINSTRVIRGKRHGANVERPGKLCGQLSHLFDFALLASDNRPIAGCLCLIASFPENLPCVRAVFVNSCGRGWNYLKTAACWHVKFHLFAKGRCLSPVTTTATTSSWAASDVISRSHATARHNPLLPSTRLSFVAWAAMTTTLTRICIPSPSGFSPIH